jgi:hypothetical protein
VGPGTVRVVFSPAIPFDASTEPRLEAQVVAAFERALARDTRGRQ